ncbi:DNA-directed RNA polymerase, mitochondrial [Ooceraea biroi]|uniref:DNA-directed RNA polymerase n=1 Tax=Ooceraea biroi TaxID=2015173 RepID=A0A026WFB8_OOCBI|nr:DNA-directed RNA polymerase, mitochondrial [Ooceraea biroi]
MFSFLRTHSVSMQSARIMSTYTTTQRSMRICSFCKFHHLKPRPTRYALLRHYSTIDSLELHAPLKKKIKHRSKKYAELLEVTDQVTNNRRAAVRKLNSTHLSALMDQPDVTLDKLHKVTKAMSTAVKGTTTQCKEKSVFEVNTKVDSIHSAILKESSEYLQDTTAIVEDLKQSGVSDHTMLLKDSSFLNTLQQINKTDDKDVDQNDTHVQTSKCNKNFRSLIPFMKEKDKFEYSISDHNLMSQLLVYMDIYVQLRMPQKAQRILMQTIEQFKYSKVGTAPLYNLLIETHVSGAQLEKVLEIYEIMKTHSVQPNAKTYVLLLHMVAKIKNHKRRKEIVTELTADMKKGNISFDDVMNTMMNTARRNAVLQCIRLVDPKYQIQYRDIDTAYDCKLLQNLTATESKQQTPAEGVVTMDELHDMLHTQIDMEKQCKLKVQSVAPLNGDSHVRQQAANRIAELEQFWKSSVTEAFERNVTYLKEHEIRMKSEWKSLYPFLQVLPKEEYINAILNEINQLAKSSDMYSSSMLALYHNLGNSIYKKYELQRKVKAGVVQSVIRIYKEYLKWYLQTNVADKNINGRVKWQQLIQEANRSGVYSDITVPEWPRSVLLKFLYNIIVNNVKIPHKPDTPDRQIPAFYLLFRNKGNAFLTEEIKPHPQLHRLYKDADPETLIFDTVLLPTYVPPRPWVDIKAGGFLLSKTNFIRDVYTRMTPVHLLRNTPTQELYPAFDCLNQLGTIPWKINEPMLDILIQIFQEGGSEELNVPQSPSVLPSASDVIGTEKNRNKLSQLLLELRRRKNELYSLWCDCLYKLSLANHFRGKTFWLPHNLDFRGRAYPAPPHLTHLSSDLSRSILMFAQGKPLGPNGLDWLKIHTINLTGMKKREPTYKRLEYANEVLDLIIDSARNPLTGQKWWTKSDEPWQTLAACKEIDNALQSPNVDEYVSRLPIHQDGSCNGLQHYAALGRDQIGAESVNLYPSSTPQDVYSVVVGMVEQFRKADAEAGNEVAKILEGHISRKVIKQTVMTTVYGVTKFGARLQITRQLSDLKEFDQNYTWSGSLYLVEQTFKSLRTMFTSAKEIQDWFTDCSRVISTRCNQYVQWQTPLGLPVMQPYFKRGKSTHSNKILKITKRNDKDLSLQVLKQLPKKGDFDITKVLSSEYFFS